MVTASCDGGEADKSGVLVLLVSGFGPSVSFSLGPLVFPFKKTEKEKSELRRCTYEFGFRVPVSSPVEEPP